MTGGNNENFTKERESQSDLMVMKMTVREMTRKDIESMGLPVYGFGSYDVPLGETPIDNCIGYNCGECGCNYNIYLNTFADGSKYIVVAGYRDCMPKKWKDNGCDLFVHQIQRGLQLI